MERKWCLTFIFLIFISLDSFLLVIDPIYWLVGKNLKLCRVSIDPLLTGKSQKRANTAMISNEDLMQGLLREPKCCLILVF